MATTTLTADREEALLRGYIPLQNLDAIKGQGNLEEITFEGNGYLTDAVLHLLNKNCSSKKDIFSNLKKVDLLGCSLITDHGIQALVQCLRCADNLTEVNLGGCDLLTDSAFSMLREITQGNKGVKGNMKGSSVCLQTGSSRNIDTTGCPVLLTTDEDYKKGQVLIVPQPHLTTSVGDYLYSGKVVDKSGGFHKNDLKVGDWTMSLTEISPSSCLVDNLVSAGRSQVMIPFDASSDPKDIKRHVMTTICRALAKEPVWQKLDSTGVNVTPTQSLVPFLDTFKIATLELTDRDDGTKNLRNISLSESVIGMYASRERFTRSNSYFEVSVSRESGEGKVGLLVGCLYDLLYDDRNPMESTSDVGGMVDGFEVDNTVKTVGFGIEGEWLSEYVPDQYADFYFVENGVKCKAKNAEDFLKPNGSMYPIISVLGECISCVNLPPIIEAPMEVLNKWKKENKWIEKGFAQDCLIDKEGRLTYCRNYASGAGKSIFMGQEELRVQQTYSFSVIVKEMAAVAPQPTETDFSIGLTGENFKSFTSNAKNIGFALAFKATSSSSTSKAKVVCEACNSKADQPLDTLEIDLKPGDVITLKCNVIEVKNISTKIDMTFSHNDKKVYSSPVEFTHKILARILPYIGMKNKNDVLILKNYRPAYHRPAPFRDRITVGRCHYLNVMDDGQCEYKVPPKFPNTAKTYGWFMSKTPFNKDLLEFSVEVLRLSSQKLFGIGVTEPDFAMTSSFCGWKQDQLGYHADNGKIYQNDGTGSSKDFKGGPIDSKINDGDIIKVKVAPHDNETPLQFDEDGDLKSHQKLRILFYKNNELMYDVEHQFSSEGLYPAFSTKDSTVRVLNFYPETAELWEQLTAVKENKEVEKKTEPEEEKVKTVFSGTEFLVVGITNGASDPAGKLQMLQQQLDQLDKSSFHEMLNLATAISEMEKDLSLMDLQEQQRYGQLCGAQNNLLHFIENVKTRVKYLAVNCSSDKAEEDRERVLKEIVKTETNLKGLQPLRYKKFVLKKADGEDSLTMENVLLKELSSAKILKFSNIFKQVSDLETKDGRTVLGLLKLMHSRGELLLLDLGSDTVIADIEYMLSLERNLWQLLPADLVKIGTTVTCIGESSHVWENSAVDQKIIGTIPGSKDDSEKSEQRKLILSLLEKFLGLIQVPCLRTNPDEDPSVYVIQQNVTSPAKPLTDYWSNGKDQTNYVVMKQVYTFPLGLPEHALPLIISNTTKYGRMIVLSGGGVVYQNGAVQTVIVKHDMNGKDVINLESWCYMPDLDTYDDSRMSKLTPSYVKDYTWNVFCLFTDIVDDLLQRSNMVAMVTKDFPKDLVNVSVGCKHSWMNNSNCSVVQSVCTLCNRCCGNEGDCPWNGIMGEYLRQSGCCADTSGCQSCGICIPCAREMWDIRSRLRPHGNTITQVEKSLMEKLPIPAPKEGENATEKQTLRDPLKESIVSLDPYIYNEVEFTNLSPNDKILYLREESDGTITKAFPGSAASVKDLETVKTGKGLNLLFEFTGKGPNLLLKNGDHVKLKLTDPLGASLLASKDAQRAEDLLPIEPQYFASIGREVKVIHESGIVMYDTTSNAIPVGQLIAVRPMTKEFDNFSIRVLSVGEKGTIAMGLGPQNYAPNRQPGWNSQSIGYHADDGGIYLESGYPTRKTQTCKVGDIMSFYIDFSRNKGFFRKNGEKMIELNLNFNKLACYPMIGLHSPGEAVEILEKEFWTPKTEQERSKTPPAFATYQYGNLWISPGDVVQLTKLTSKFLSGWVVLHNPLKDAVGFKLSCDGVEDLKFFGIIEHKKSWLKELKIPVDETVNAVVIEWTSLESGRTYTEDEMKILFGKTSDQMNQSSHQHRLRVEFSDTKAIVEELKPVAAGDPKDKKSLCLHVYKNLKLVDEYWLKYGNYHVSVETSSKMAKFLLKYPKCPSFTYPRGFQKGMKFVIYLESENAFVECVVVEVYPGGRSLALEYSPKDQTTNMTVCIMTSSSAFTFKEFDKDKSYIIPYETRNTPLNLTRTFVNAPPYLLAEGARKTLPFLYPEWKANTMKSMAECSQVFTRLTVQEQHIWNAARNLMDWYPEDYEGHLFTFLPSQLTQSKMLYPQPEQMFNDISVHRLCFAQNELLLSSTYHNETLFEIPLKLALHYADIPGIPPDKTLPVDILFGDGLNVWTYIALISTRLYLPSFKKMIPDDSGRLSRQQIEQLLYSLLQTYASLCGIYAASWGGIQYSQMSEVKDVKRAIKHEDKYLKHLTPEPHLDPHVLIQKGDFAVCKAHLMNYGVVDNSFLKEGVDFKYEFFEPYMDHVTIFNWGYEGLEGLPEDFFKRFSNLVQFQLEAMPKFKKLPEGIGNARKLRCVEISNAALEKLPEDILLCTNLETLKCINLPVRALPTQWPEDSKLENLDLCGLLIKEIPTEIGKLKELKDLDLCRNPITDLPKSLENLKKLNILRVGGCPLLTLEGNRSQMRPHHTQLYIQNPVIKYELGYDTVEKLFSKYDTNNNGSLDEEEIAVLNMDMFFQIPRLGSTDINDEVTGGIPPVIFSLKSLVELHLEFNAITMVPQAINNLQNLKVLNLNHNPLLESLPGSLGHLPNISKIHITSCPMLRTPPTEVVGRGFESVKAYLKRLAGGFTECRRTKLMIVGLGGAGKTSLLRALMSEKKKTQGTEKEIPTDGIDIVPWTVASKDGQEITYSTWDFAGQAVYYNTHQFFLSKRAVYLLLWSMRQGYEHAGLDFWLSSICCHAPKTPIIVIGTQCDLIPKAEIPEKELLERYPQIASFHRVSAIEGTGIAELQESLLDVTLQQGYMGEKIPQVWLNFEKRIIAERLTKKSYIKWDVARSYAMEQGIYDEKDVRMAVQLLHDLGTVQYFDNDFLRNYVVIDPQWIVNVMACVVSAQDSPIQKNHGRFLHSDIPTVWKDYDSDLHAWLLRLTEDFDLTFPLPRQPVNIVPCLLPGEPPDDLNWPSVRDKEGVRETKMVYRFTYLPSGLFNRAQVRLFQFSDGKMVWKKGSLLSKNKHLALMKQTNNKELVVYVQGPRPENVLFLIHEVFESIIEESFNGVSYDLYLPCPDCVTKEGTAEPDLLNAKLIQRAKDLKAPFIQCYKYFHWISMAQLQEKMPASSREVADFDIQLQQSVVALQELNNDLVVDTAILYSMADVPSPGDSNKLAPSQIRDDIRSWGFSCWFSEDMENVSVVDMTAAVKNCKILIVLISDEFERDSKCHDLFLYAKETMNKDIIIVVLGESLEWENKHLGMKIGKQERKLMAKTKQRYEVEGGRREELKEWLTEKLSLLTQEAILPDVFISYCWVNSLSAAEKSGRMYSEALGWGDPRQLKAVLQERGISCWIDTEYVGKDKKGIFADMAAGIRNSKAFLAFISDEYAESDNCMMELRFGVINVELPVVAAIVGTQSGWKQTEVAMLLGRAQANEVSLQKKNPEGIEVLIKFVQDALQKAKLAGPKKKKKNDAIDLIKQGKESKPKNKSTSIAYQEEVELIQRKFMRHILGSIIVVDTIPLPRLIVVDFVKSAKQQKAEEGRDSSLKMSSMPRKTLRPKTATKSRDRLQVDKDVLEDEDDDWTKESLCIKLLCEHEGGWHVCEQMYPLAFRTRDTMEQFIAKASPYLYRIYTVLKQGPIKLKCFSSGKGNAFQNWITKESEENLDFVGSMMHLRSHLATDEAADFVSCLARCRLPSGKILWLCEKHQQEEHVAKLSTDSRGSSYNVTKVLFNEDKFLLEHMEKSKEYKKRKGIKSNKVAPKLPKPVPIPVFIPPQSTPEPERKSSPLPERKASPQPKPDDKQKGTDKTITETTIKDDKNIKENEPEEKPDSEKLDRGKPTDGITKEPIKNNSKSEEDSKLDTQTDKQQKHGGDIDRVAERKDKEDGGEKPDDAIKATATKSKRKDSYKETEKKPDEAIKVTATKSKRKDSYKEIEETEKDKIKRMILQSDAKAMKKAMRKPVSKTLSQQGFNVQPNDMKTLPRKQSLPVNSFSNIRKGSNVKRFQTSTSQSETSESRTSSQGSSVELDSTLQIQTVNRSENGSGKSDTVKQTKVSKGSTGSKSADSSETFPLDKVRPKKIHVQPKRKTSEGVGTSKNMTATGIGVGVTKGAEMPLPERTDSKACVLQ